MGVDQYALSTADVFGSVYGTPEPTINGKTYHWGDAIIQYEGVKIEPVKNKVEEVQHKDTEVKPVKNNVEKGDFLVNFHDVSVLDKETKAALVNVKINTETLEATGYIPDNADELSQDYSVFADKVNVRNAPSIDGEVIGVLYQGTTVAVLDVNIQDWYEINYNDQLGYVECTAISQSSISNRPMDKQSRETNNAVGVPVVATTYLTTSAKPIDWSIKTQ